MEEGKDGGVLFEKTPAQSKRFLDAKAASLEESDDSAIHPLQFKLMGACALDPLMSQFCSMWNKWGVFGQGRPQKRTEFVF
jgi:hypothetical protein